MRSRYSQKDFGEAYAKLLQASVFSGALGGVMASGLLQLDVSGNVGLSLGGLGEGWLWGQGVLGLRGWRWLFLVEGLPALALGIALPWVLPRTPADARFLSPEQQRWVARRVAEGDATTAATFGGTHPARDWKVWYWGIAT